MALVFSQCPFPSLPLITLHDSLSTHTAVGMSHWAPGARLWTAAEERGGEPAGGSAETWGRSIGRLIWADEFLR